MINSNHVLPWRTEDNKCNVFEYIGEFECIELFVFECNLKISLKRRFFWRLGYGNSFWRRIPYPNLQKNRSFKKKKKEKPTIFLFNSILSIFKRTAHASAVISPFLDAKKRTRKSLQLPTSKNSDWPMTFIVKYNFKSLSISRLQRWWNYRNWDRPYPFLKAKQNNNYDTASKMTKLRGMVKFQTRPVLFRFRSLNIFKYITFIFKYTFTMWSILELGSFLFSTLRSQSSLNLAKFRFGNNDHFDLPARAT